MKKAKVRKRQVIHEAKSDEVAEKFIKGEATISPSSLKRLEAMSKNDDAKMSAVGDDPVFATASEYGQVLIQYIKPSINNSRYLPIESPADESPEAVALLKDCVVCEKGIIENRFKPSHERYGDVEEELANIRELALSFDETELINPIVVWRSNTTNFPIVAGHSRYYALRYKYGRKVKVPCKIYPERPKNVELVRHIENSRRKDLSFQDNLDSWHRAFETIEDKVRLLRGTERNKMVCQIMGCSEGTRFNYEKLDKYFFPITKLIERNLLSSVAGAMQLIKTLENEHDNNHLAVKSKLDEFYIHRNIDLQRVEHDNDALGKPQKKRKAASAKKYFSMPKIKIEQGGALKRLLQEDVTKIDIGVHWDDVDYEDPKQVEAVLKTLIESLTTKT